MSDTPQQYILRQPITRDGGSDDEDFGGYYIYTGESSDAHAFIYPDGFDALFVPLDVQALREQVDKLSIRIAHDLQVEDISWDETRSIIEQHLYDEVLVLFGLHNTEETQ